MSYQLPPFHVPIMIVMPAYMMTIPAMILTHVGILSNTVMLPSQLPAKTNNDERIRINPTPRAISQMGHNTIH